MTDPLDAWMWRSMWKLAGVMAVMFWLIVAAWRFFR